MEAAAVLIEALPYIRRFHGTTVVVKFGGAVVDDAARLSALMQDIVLIKYVGMRPVVVHGGGPQVSEIMTRMNLQPVFHNGLRITDRETMAVTEMVLNGRINKAIVSMIDRHGGRAVGISGKDGLLLKARKHIPADGTDLGFVGEIAEVNPHLLQILDEAEFIPVVSPVAIGEDGESYNINADTAAAAIAGALAAEKLIFCTDVAGILDKNGQLISELTAARVKALQADGTIRGGMLPKLDACLAAMGQGLRNLHILDGRQPHALLLELFTDAGIGSVVRP